MLLHHEILGRGEPVVILHGLMGSCDNWRGIARDLASDYQVIAVDLPNHGRSPHTPEVTLASMGEAVVESVAAAGIGAPVALVGHSMGGKVAMALTQSHPAWVSHLVVVDISPRAIKPVHLFIMRACLALDLAKATRRSELDEALAESIPFEETRSFLLKNVARNTQGEFYWRVPLEYLIANYHVVSNAVELPTQWCGPALFMAGAESPFGLSEDRGLIRGHFPTAKLVKIPRAGHLVHSDNPVAFCSVLREFLK